MNCPHNGNHPGRCVSGEEVYMTALRLCVDLDNDYPTALSVCLDNMQELPDSELPLWGMVGHLISQWAQLPLWLEPPVTIPMEMEED